MTDRLIRLMRIITLVQAKPGILARELAQRCETTERTIYRDMEALSAMHIPIANMGHGQGYMFISQFAMYPLNWSDEEAQAFMHLAEVMENIRPLLKPAFESAYEKVVAASQKNKTERVEWSEQISGLFKAGLPAWQNENNDSQNQSMITLLQAGISQNTIEGEYLSQGKKGIVRIDPYCLIPREYRFEPVRVLSPVGETSNISGEPAAKDTDIATHVSQRGLSHAIALPHSLGIRGKYGVDCVQNSICTPCCGACDAGAIFYATHPNH